MFQQKVTKKTKEQNLKRFLVLTRNEGAPNAEMKMPIAQVCGKLSKRCEDWSVLRKRGKPPTLGSNENYAATSAIPVDLKRSTLFF